MEHNATPGNGVGQVSDGKSPNHRGAKYTKVFDGRNRRIRGLWKRGKRFYGQLRLMDPATGAKVQRRVPLGTEENPVTNITQAKAALAALIADRDREEVKARPRAPRFDDYAAQYVERVKGTKRDSSLYKERNMLNRWGAHFGDKRIRDIRKRDVMAFREKMLGKRLSPNTVNKYQFALSNVFKMAIADEIVDDSPTRNLPPLKFDTKRRELLTEAQIDKICREARKHSKNGELFSDYIRLLAFSGARRNEGLALKWADVNFTRKQLHIGSEGDAKNRQPRTVDMTTKLEEHLQDMFKRRQPDSEYMFPSPQRGRADRSTKTFRETLTIARENSGVDLNFHDLRHYFISKAVMAGIDFMTIAKWVGHKDGGILIGKVYGHLADGHRKQMAAKLTF